MIKPVVLGLSVLFVTFVSTAVIEKDVEKTLISDESKLKPNIEVAITEEKDLKSELKPVQVSEVLKPVQESGSLKPVQKSEVLKPVQESGSLKPVQENGFLKPIQESGFLRPVQESEFLKPIQETKLNPIENELKPVQEDDENPIPEEVSNETPLKILFGGNKCKEVLLKTIDGKVFTSWLGKDCPPNKPFLQPDKPLFNSGFGTLPIPTVPPMMPDDLPKHLLPLQPVQ